MTESLADKKRRARKIITRLKREFPDARTALHFSNPLEMLVATILSAQCTDERVNEVTKSLFRKYRSAHDYAGAPQGELERDIRPTGFFNQKARSLRGCCSALVKHHKGEIPKSLDELVALPGVGRKTANLVLGSAFGIPGIVVDTHVKRLSGRLGLSDETDPDKIELDLQPLVAKKDWTLLSDTLILHGRNICIARKPRCNDCVLVSLCPFPDKNL